MPLLKIANGRIYDPAHGRDGVVGDLWIRDGIVIAPPAGADVRADRVIDATGLVVMPGGVDMHCHIAGSKVNAARKMRPEDKQPFARHGAFRSGTGGTVPSTFTTGYLYAGLGYTAAFDAAVPPLSARHVHEEFHDTPILDKGFFVMLGNNQYLLQQLAAGDHRQACNYLGWIVNTARAYGVKVVNPGGVEVWKQSGGSVRSIDDVIPEFNITPRQIVREIARSVDELGLPHAMHLHCTNLGVPGNASTTLETMQALEGHRAHLAHIQFHSYGGDPDDQSTFCSRVPELVEYISAHPNVSVDVGQVLFGPATAMTGDSALGYYLHKLLGAKWYSCDLEMEAGCGIVPIVYKQKSFVHALQWAIGLEWYLLMPDPWRIAMSTDHPNGASFLAYPQIIALLMDRNRRDEMLQQLPAGIREKCTLGDITREYTLSEIAIITRAAPARMLGLTQKGHLGPGADGDVTLYQPQTDLQQMFELPRYLVCGGEVILDDGELVKEQPGRTLYSAPGFDEACVPAIADWFNEHYSLRFGNYGVDDNFLPHGREVACVQK
ncbi:formylmethanofuran dehydrogenase subunit A [Planctomicrobium piriforme]|uniref:Formylmethanofuran dehydrogenase subunit A n=1 Tax=Planctomicrobium piriforme TaxID=1576369 RepID=A0A1I3P4H6_9PLAN|nr:formylmethanofuran dehydrogenase subunit A [Planctomicrobium piriforme]SFJ16237.1 formylmethanofuran dehydrogenase subunit A [Planctomicrobium piriforme]